MLIYNYKKEFVGIDEVDLKALGFSDLSQLRNESADFADLFVKTPGFVHNFKHVHWIDFVTCAEGNEESKVVIHASGKSYKCTLDIKTAYLVDNPSQKAYIINLVNLRALTHLENEKVASDVLEKSAPIISTENTAIFNTLDVEDNKNNKVFENEKVEVTHDPYEVSKGDTLDELELNNKVVKDIYESSHFDFNEELVEVDESDNGLEEEISTQEVEEESSQEVLEQKSSLDKQTPSHGSDYVYDPKLASDELGLPVDLIEEFIQDFISQANDFKDDLYDSLSQNNIDNVKILSHKLKGVAANLRVEDAFEVLTTVNTSSDNAEIKENIDAFYGMIKKLSESHGKLLPSKKETITEEENLEEELEDEDLIISFKDEIKKPAMQKIQIDDSEVPQKIEMPELADDDFIEIDEPTQEDIDIELDELEELDTITLDEEIEISNEPKTVKYDKSKAANEIGIDEKSFHVLFDDFLDESKNACLEVNKAIEQNNPILWKKAAIKLKGMSDNMRIHDYQVELESIINTQDSDRAKEAVDAIVNKLQQISDEEV
nr:Hpt domain-containing protein [uncultured Sulfurimonas sp.]